MAEALGDGFDLRALDVTDGDAARRALDHPELDVLVLAAGTNVTDRKLEQLSPEDWHELVDTNLTGVYNLVAAALPALRAARGIAIIVGSVSGLGPDLSGPGYQATKAGVLALARGAALEEYERGTGVRFSVVAPGRGRHPDTGPPPGAAVARAARAGAHGRGGRGDVRVPRGAAAEHARAGADRAPDRAAGTRPHELTVKRIGLLGGMSWESSIEYYRLVNEATRERLGGLHSADCLLRSVDFTDIEVLQREGRWDEAGARLAAEAAGLVAAGAELIVLCTNTMHKVADAITDAIDVPFVHIADTTAEAVRARGLHTVGLLATAYTMEQDFYVGRLRDRHGLEVLVPDEADRQIVHRVIYEELCVGVIEDGSRDEYRRIMAGLADRGAEAILLGCTEIDLLVGPEDSPVPVFDTTRLHAERAVELAIAG